MLQLEHKNGDRCDNRLENLELLCPNCHSQTKTYSIGMRLPKEKPKCISCKKEIGTRRKTEMCCKCLFQFNMSKKIKS